MVGSHLAEYLLNEVPEAEVFGTFRWRSKLDNLDDIRRAGKLNVLDEGQRVTDAESLQRFMRPGQVTVVDCELKDATAVRNVIRAIRPDRVFHLAAQSFVPTSWTAPAETITNNVISQVNLFEAIREAGLDPIVHVAGSSEEYGLVLPSEAPIKETNPLRPLSHYAVSKVTQETLATQYHRSYGLKTVVTRGFNHDGPRRGQVFATSSFAKQIAQVEAGLQEPVIRTGDLDSQRDFSDVRDMVRAYWLATERCTFGDVYNVGRGECMRVGEMLEILLSHAHVPIQVQQDPSRMRPSDVPLLWANVDKFTSATGWRPQIPNKQTQTNKQNYWRARIGGAQLAKQNGRARLMAAAH